MTEGLPPAAARHEPAVSGWRTALARHSELLTRPAEMLMRLSVLVREAVPVGLLRRHEILHAVRQAYRGAPDFYDPDVYRLRFEADLLPLLERHAGGRRLLDLYCGQGREAAIFSEAGYEVLGVDEDASSVAKARAHLARRGYGAEFVAADVDRWQPSDGAFDVVYSSLWMYSCIPDRAARVAWLERVAGWMGEGGVMVISVTPRRSPRSARARHLVARSLSMLTGNRRRPELGLRIFTAEALAALEAKPVIQALE